MAEKKRRRTTDKWKKKKWYEILAPAILDKKKIADTVAEKPESLEGRTLMLSVRDVSGQARKQQVMLKFRVDNVQGLKAYTQLLGHEVKTSYIRRMIRRNVSKINVIEDLTTKDGKRIRVNAITITGNKFPEQKRTDVRKVMREIIRKEAKSKNYDELVYEFVFGNISASIFNEVKKIGIIKRVEIIKSKPIKS